MATTKFAIKMIQVAFGDTNIRTAISINGAQVAADYELTSVDLENPNVFECTADIDILPQDIAIEFTILNSDDISAGGYINVTDVGYVQQYTDGKYYKGIWRRHASAIDANAPWPVSSVGVDGIVLVPRPESQYFNTSAEQQAIGLPAVLTDWLVKEDNESYVWSGQRLNPSGEFTSNSMTVTAGSRFIPSY